MQFNIILKENSPYTYYCPRPLVAGDIRAYRIVIKTEQILEGAHLLITAIRSDGQAITDIGEMYGGYGEYTLTSNMYEVEGDMRLLIAIVDYDGATLTAKEVMFTVTSGGNSPVDGDDRVPALSRLISQCNDLLDECSLLKDGYGEIINLYTNLLSQNCISHNTTNGTVDISGLEKGKAYCFNFIPYDVIGITDDGEAESVTYSSYGNNTYIAAVNMNYSTLSIPFDLSLESEYFMLFEGNELPERFKAYDAQAYINDGFLTSVYAELDRLKTATVSISQDLHGEVRLKPNVVHNLIASEDLRFLLPSVNAHTTAIVHAIIENEISIDWGTTYFYNGEIPYITTGEYEFIFSWIRGRWVVGVLEIGEGAAS